MVQPVNVSGKQVVRLVLTQDVQLSLQNGHEGQQVTLLLEQDKRGGHKVSGVNISGILDIGMAPGEVTAQQFSYDDRSNDWQSVSAKHVSEPRKPVAPVAEPVPVKWDGRERRFKNDAVQFDKRNLVKSDVYSGKERRLKAGPIPAPGIERRGVQAAAPNDAFARHQAMLNAQKSAPASQGVTLGPPVAPGTVKVV
jgi:hypothetical protein